MTFADIVIERRVGAAWDFGTLIVWLIIAACIVAIAVIVVKALGWQIPNWFFQILLVLALAVVAILAVRFLLSL